MTRNEFAQLLSRRDEGFWELLATAANVKTSVERTASALQNSALLEVLDPLSATPSLVEDRVESLAVANIETLIEVSKGWRQVHSLSKAEMVDGSCDMLVAAWSRSVRHLSHDGRGLILSVQSEVPAIRSELDVCTSNRSRRFRTWSEVMRLISKADTTYADLRIEAPTGLEEDIVTESMLREFFLSGTSDSSVSRIGRARLLRGLRDLLEGNAVSWLQEHLKLLATSDIESIWTHEFCAAAELAKTDAYFDHLRSTVAAALADSANPRQAASLCYVLLERSWQVP